MHSPGEISQVANLFDSRIFEEPNFNSEPNIEFHIHAFLNPNQSAQNNNQPAANQNGPINQAGNRIATFQDASVGPDGILPMSPSANQ